MDQYHTPSQLREQYLGSQGLPTALDDFDGHAEFVVPDQNCMKAVVEDPFYKDVVVKDEAKFLKRESTVWRVGYEQVWIRDGQVVEGPPSSE
ncbi:MAG: hypothetical protein Q9167_007032 [Letrouitia subvulpina]